MKKLLQFGILAYLLTLYASGVEAQSLDPLRPAHFNQNYCDHEQLELNAQKIDPLYQLKMEEFERTYRDMVQNFILNNPDAGQTIGNRTVYTIPVVVHVMHLSGTPVGMGENISMAQIEQGIQDMSDAFRHTGGPAYTDPSHHVPPINGVDVEIQFCLAKRTPDNLPTSGVNRVATSLSNLLRDVPLPTPNPASQDLQLKNLSRWDPTKYLNIWLVNEICITAGDCGVAGYAFFSSAHGQPYDGIVNEADLFGISQDDSKVHIHEAGHYFNLDHTFNAGCPNSNCLVDGDKVCDTPPDNSTAPVTCSTAANTCTTDVPDIDDLYEDYMDYGYQSCQSIFTAGQATRMQTALTTTRASLTTSNGCLATTTDALAYFYDNGTTVTESSSGGTDGCRGYANVSVRIQLYNPAPAGGTTVTVGFSAGTADTPADYIYMTNPVVIPAGSSSGDVVIRVYDDRAVEGVETLILGITAVSGGSPASFQQIFTLTINDNDNAPSGTRPTIDTDDFSSGGWTQSAFNAFSENLWEFGSNGDCMTGTSAYISNDGGANNDYQIDAVQTNALLYQPMNVSGYTGVQMTFDCIINGNATDRGRIVGRPVAGTGGFTIFSSPNLFDKPCPTPFQASFNFPNTYTTTPDIGFYFFSNNGTPENPAFTIDNMELTADGTAPASAVASVTEYFGPLSTVYFKDGSGNLIGKIKNLSSWDYGCTTFAINQAGESAFHPTNFPTIWMTTKTLTVVPTNNNPTGQNEITLYYTANEISGWTAAAGLPQTSMRVTKAPNSWAGGGASNTSGNTTNFATTQTSWGIHTAFTATVTGGFSGFALSNLGAPALPVEITDFRGKLTPDKKSIALDWRTATESNNSHFTLDRANDGGRVFENINVQPGSGTTQSAHKYQFLDKHARPGTNIYRLSHTDFNGKTEAIGLVSVELPFPASFNILPNPVEEGSEMAILASLPQAGLIEITGFDISGRLVFSEKMELEKGESLVPLASKLPPGIYAIRIAHENGQHVQRLIVH